LFSSGVQISNTSFKVRLGIAFLCLWLLSGCALNNGMRSNELHSFGADGNAIAAFQQSIYPMLKNNCATCHGVDQSPLFASDNVQAAYNGAIAAVNFAAPGASRLVARLSADSHNCWSDCNGNAAAMAGAIQRWMDLANGSSNQGPPRIELAGQDVPASLPSPPLTGANNSYVTMTYPLDSLGFTGATFTFEIQSYNSTHYGIRSPKLNNLSSKAYVKNLRLLVNRLYRPNESTFTFINVTVSPPGGDLLISQPMLVLKSQNGVDSIAPSFEKFELAP
jgi:hypothetical protein